MAKRSYTLMQLVNDEVRTKTKWIVHIPNKGIKQGHSLRKRKYDPVTKKHHWFVTKKMPSHSKN